MYHIHFVDKSTSFLWRLVKAIIPKGLKKGEYLGRVIVRSRGYFDIKMKNSSVKDIGYKYCRLIQRGDGYLYNYKECDFLSNIHNRVSIVKKNKKEKR